MVREDRWTIILSELRDRGFVGGDSREVAANEDYDTFGISNRMQLSKATDITIGYIRKGLQGTGNSIKTYGLGITHSF